jgi:hypothetical protein
MNKKLTILATILLLILLVTMTAGCMPPEAHFKRLDNNTIEIWRANGPPFTVNTTEFEKNYSGIPPG